MVNRIVICNQSNNELGLMLEPLAIREDVPANGQAIIEGNFADDELVIDVFSGEDFVSVWSPPHATIRLR